MSAAVAHAGTKAGVECALDKRQCLKMGHTHHGLSLDLHGAFCFERQAEDDILISRRGRVR